MTGQPEITQRDLRNRSKEIMDAVKGGHSFTITRDGHQIGELIPLRRRRRFVPRAKFAAMSRNAAASDLDSFRTDQEIALDQATSDRMSSNSHTQGLLDTNILILRRWVDSAELPDEMAISAITLAELSAGPHQVRRNDEQTVYDEHAERARRLDVLQRVENEFDPIPFGTEAARAYGRVSAAVVRNWTHATTQDRGSHDRGDGYRRRSPLFTTNPDDYKGLEAVLSVVPVTRPAVPHEFR